jgi:peptide/nickel transport system substrate-binding protein
MRRFVSVLAVAGAIVIPFAAEAAKDSVIIGMRLEPPGLDPTTGAAAAISQITLYNVFEGLTKITPSGGVAPLLAESWSISDDFKTWTFKLRQGVTFHDGSAFDASDVKFAFERNQGDDSKNKRKKRFDNMASIEVVDSHTLVIALKNPNPDFLFNLGESTAIIVAPETAENNKTNPIGTGGYKFVKWTKGDSVELAKFANHRDAADMAISTVKFRFVSDSAAQVAGMMAGDIDLLPVGAPGASLAQFEADPDFVVLEGNTNGETILSINNRHPILYDVRVRRAIQHAIDRQTLIDAAQFGYGTPIGSHFAPHHPDYLDLTGVHPYDPEKAKALLAEAGHGEGFTLTLKLPPPEYARKGGQVIAEMLGEVGITVEIENVEWAQWLDVVYKKRNFDLSIVSHVEPMDMSIYARKSYYFQYDSAAFKEIMAKADTELDPMRRREYLQMAQRALADDAVNGYLFQLAKTAVFRKGLNGIWQDSHIFVNDVSAMSWSD